MNRHISARRQIETNNPAERLSINLNRLMAEYQIDGVQLSKHTGVPVTTINRLRKLDANNNPTLTTLAPLANFFVISISQLVGDEPIPNTVIKSVYRPDSNAMMYLPILTWHESIKWPKSKKDRHENIATEYTYSDNSFALIVEESNWENISNGAALLIDPALEALHRDYIIVHKNGQLSPTLKQLLFDEDNKYLKPLVSGYDITPYTPEHRILGVAVEFKKNLKNK